MSDLTLAEKLERLAMWFRLNGTHNAPRENEARVCEEAASVLRVQRAAAEIAELRDVVESSETRASEARLRSMNAERETERLRELLAEAQRYINFCRFTEPAAGNLFERVTAALERGAP